MVNLVTKVISLRTGQALYAIAVSAVAAWFQCCIDPHAGAHKAARQQELAARGRLHQQKFQAKLDSVAAVPSCTAKFAATI